MITKKNTSPPVTKTDKEKSFKERTSPKRMAQRIKALDLPAAEKLDILKLYVEILG